MQVPFISYKPQDFFQQEPACRSASQLQSTFALSRDNVRLFVRTTKGWW